MSLAVPPLPGSPVVARAPDQLPLAFTDPAPTSVVLRPGVRVVRRDERHQQVGLDELAVVVADDPGTDAVLADLAAGRPVPRGRLVPWLAARLDERGLLVDPRVVQGPGVGSGGEGAARSVAAAYAAHGPEAALRLAGRRSRTVAVLGPDPWAVEARRLLTLAGLGVRPAGARRPLGGGPGAGGADAAAALVLSAGEPRRCDLDAAVQLGRPHLLVSAVQGRYRVGPFVVPGVTACLRCVDAHLSEQDPRRALVVEQQSPGDEPVDPVLSTLASALAVRDLVAWAEGGRPASWSATVWVEHGADPAPRPWSPHPHCGCGWGNRLPVD